MSDSFRIVVTGQAAFGESVLKALVEKGESVVGVFCAPDVEGKPADPIKAAANEHGIPVFQFKRLRNADAIEAFQSLDADLGVMAFVTDIVPEDILNAPRLGTIQYHPSLLPKHRGPSSINWPIIQGETKTGLSIFWPDAGLDTGPILMQKEVDIGPNDTLGSVYFDHLFPIGVDAMIESVEMVKTGNAPKIQQDESQQTYEGWCRAGDAIVDWSKPAAEVYNLVRGADPSPGAGTSFDGLGLQLFNASKREEATDGEPGEIVRIADGEIEVAGVGGTISIARVRAKGSGKMAAQEWAEQAGLSVGGRLGA